MGASDELSPGKDLQSFQVGFLGLGGFRMGLSNEASPVLFALACSGMYAANTRGLDAGQGQVEEHTRKQRQERNSCTGMPNCLSRGRAWTQPLTFLGSYIVHFLYTSPFL